MTTDRWLSMVVATMVACAGPLLGCVDGPHEDGDGDADADGDGDGEAPSNVPGTGQTRCYGTSGEIDCPASEGAEYSGQDASYDRDGPSYVDNGDGTITDEITGLMWVQAPVPASFDEAESVCAGLTTGGHDDWRVPSITEMYSLVDFDGTTGTAAPDSAEVPDDAVPYIDTEFFVFDYGTEVEGVGNRYIDSQYITTTVYAGTVMGGETCFFGVNLADGRIKCYPTNPFHGLAYFLQCVRGAEYGVSDLEDNGDGTITDHETGLTWLQHDSGHLGAGALGDGEVDWVEALELCEELELAGYTDWRLPDAKELQSLVDYGRSPDATRSPAIDPLFRSTGITNEAGQADWGFYWASTTHLDGRIMGESAVYVAFGRGMGQMNGDVMDVHGAGCQRSDPKVSASREPTCGMGPQGDCRRTYNLARCVRG